MRRSLALPLVGILVCAAVGGSGKAAESPTDLPRQGHAILKKYCYQCHGVRFEKPPLNVLDLTVLLKERRKPYVVPGKPDASSLWQRVRDGDMPPEEVKDRPTEEEKRILRAWIEAGAVFPTQETRRFQGRTDVLTAIRNDLRKLPARDRKFQRYFTLAHLHNSDLAEQDLRLARAALSKLLNSLSWQSEIVVPRAVDSEGTVYGIDLRSLGWSARESWSEILRHYPYGLRHDSDPDADLRGLYQEICELSDCDVPWVRADWFIATAARPPLYHTLLRLPDNAGDLEKLLRVDFAANFRGNQVVRSAFTTSGVSRQNRLVERQPARYGVWWKSYDFQTSSEAGNLLRFPLGPVFPDNPFKDHGFRHAGGEIVFSLPNRLNGYLLVDDKDRRLDRAPVGIVRDSLETAGTPEVVNGLSCMSCHRHGVVRGFRDVIRSGHALRGDPAIKVAVLYRPAEEVETLLQQDEDRFLIGLAEATGSFLKVKEDRDRDIAGFAEPIGAIARLYLRDLSVQEVSGELGLDTQEVQALLKRNRRLRELGLGPLLQGGRIKREVWEREAGTSLFQETARVLELGTPHVELKGR